jgi:hypothetical protein
MQPTVSSYNSAGSNRNLPQVGDFKFHTKKSSSIMDTPLSIKNIGSSLLGKKVHISKDLLVKHRVVDRSVPQVKSPKYYSRANNRQQSSGASQMSSTKRSFFQLQEERAAEGLREIFDHVTGRQYRQTVLITDRVVSEDNQSTKAPKVTRAIENEK